MNDALPADLDEQAQIEVSDLDQFVRMLVAWHTAETNRVKMLLVVPEGTTFEIEDKELVLSGDVLEGFKLGAEMALMCLGHLPFVAQVEDVEPPVGAPVQTDDSNRPH